MIIDVNKQFFSGMKATVPVCLGIIPVGISVGLLGAFIGVFFIDDKDIIHDEENTK